MNAAQHDEQVMGDGISGQMGINSLQTSIQSYGSEREDKILKDLETFFNDSDYSDILENWRLPKLEAIKQKGNEIKRRKLESINEKIEDRLHRNIVNAEIEGYKSSIAEKAKECALGYQVTGIEDTKLKEVFDKEWKKWIDDVKTPKSTNTIEHRSKEAKDSRSN